MDAFTIIQWVIVLELFSNVFAVPTIDTSPDKLYCTSIEFSYSVVNGYPGGKTFIEGTDKSICVGTLVGNASDVFSFSFVLCNISPQTVTGGGQIEFIVVIQDYEAINTFRDPRYHVKCSFNTLSGLASVDIQLASNMPNGSSDIPVAINPRPVMSLYSIATDSSLNQITINDNVVMGQDIRMKISMSPFAPSYGLVIEYCYIDAKTLTGTSPIASQMIIGYSKCPIFPQIFPKFTYNMEWKTSPAGNTYTVPVAQSEFQAFIPTVTSINLRNTKVRITFLCQVNVCLKANPTCVEPNCTSTVRRRRDTGISNNTVVTAQRNAFQLSDGFIVQLSNYSNDLNDTTIPDNCVVPPENGFCVDWGYFWAILFSILFFILVALGSTCCTLCYVRRLRKQNRKIFGRSEESLTAPISIISEETGHGHFRFLPRFVPVSLSSFQKQQL